MNRLQRQVPGQWRYINRDRLNQKREPEQEYGNEEICLHHLPAHSTSTSIL